MSTDSVRRVLSIVSLGVSAIEAIARVAGDAAIGERPRDELVAVLRGVGAIAQSVMRGLSGSASPEDVERSLAEFRSSIAANNEAADAELDAKFPR